MDTINSTFPTKSEYAGTSHIHYLERQQRYLMSLSHQLRSYHCVPKTVTLYEQMEQLNRSLRNLMKENDELISGIYQVGVRSREYLAEYQSQFNKVLQLEHRILEYIGMAKIHG